MKETPKEKIVGLTAISSILILLTLGDIIHYYQLIKVSIVFSSIMIAITLYEEKLLSKIMKVQLVGITILFNPIIPVYLYDKGLWIIADLYVIVVFGYSSILILKNK